MSKKKELKSYRAGQQPVGRATAPIAVTEFGRFMQQTFGAPSVEKGVGSVEEKKEELQRLKYDVEIIKKSKELEKLEGGGSPAVIFWPVRQKGKIVIRRLKLNPGEVEVVGEIPLGDEEEKKKEEKARPGEIAQVIKATSDVIKTGIEAGGGKGLDIATVDKYIDAKMEAKISTVHNKLTELGGKIDKIIDKGGGAGTSEVSVIRELKELGLLKTAGKEEGEKEGLTVLSRTIKELEDAGLVVRAAKVSEQSQRLEMEKEEKGMSFWLAARKLVMEEQKAMRESTLRKEKVGLLRDFTKDIGGAIADAFEETEEEEGKKAKREEKEEVIRESKKTKGGIEQFDCQQCGGTVSIPPEAQVEGHKLVCPRCSSEYEYTLSE